MGLWERLHKDDNAATAQPSVREAIDLAQTADTGGARQEVWGRPGRCPRCGGVGYLDGVDLINRIQHEKCTECFHKWSVSESETVKL
jgi:hypothetical protein